MKKLNVGKSLNYDQLVKEVEKKARKEEDFDNDDEVEDFRFDFTDNDGCKKVCITIKGREVCFCI